jgi:hypothetical protein
MAKTLHRVTFVKTKDTRNISALRPKPSWDINPEWLTVVFQNVVATEMQRAANDSRASTYTVNKIDNSSDGDPTQARRYVSLNFGDNIGANQDINNYRMLNIAPQVVARTWNSFGVKNVTGKLRNFWHWEVTERNAATRRLVPSPEAAFPLKPRTRLLLRYEMRYAPILSTLVARKKAGVKVAKAKAKAAAAGKKYRERRVISVIVTAANTLRRDPLIHAHWFVRAINQGELTPAAHAPRFIGLMFTPRRGRTAPGAIRNFRPLPGGIE